MGYTEKPLNEMLKLASCQVLWNIHLINLQHFLIDSFEIEYCIIDLVWETVLSSTINLIYFVAIVYVRMSGGNYDPYRLLDVEDNCFFISNKCCSDVFPQQSKMLINLSKTHNTDLLLTHVSLYFRDRPRFSL